MIDQGKTEVEITNDVLIGITSLAIENVPGVEPVAAPLRVGEVLSGKRLRGINVSRLGQELTVDLSVHIEYGKSIPELGRTIQQAVIEHLELMTGLTVRAVNVTVQNVVVHSASDEGGGA